MRIGVLLSQILPVVTKKPDTAMMPAASTKDTSLERAKSKLFDCVILTKGGFAQFSFYVRFCPFYYAFSSP